MRLTLAVNIGLTDNKALLLENTHEGDVVDVNEKTAEYLLKRGWATATAAKAEPPKPEPPKAARIEGAPAGAKNAHA